MLKPFAKRVTDFMVKRTGLVTKGVMSNSKAITRNLEGQQKLLRKAISGRAIPAGYKSKSQRLRDITNPLMSVGRSIRGVTQSSVVSNASNAAQFAVGSAAMASIAVMNGGMAKMDQIMQQRYMRDSRYSSQLLAQSNVGKSMGNGRLNLGNHTGLSLSMHRGRHG